MQLESKCFFIKGVKFDYLEVCIKSCYWTSLCKKIFSGVNFLIVINPLMC